MANRNYANGRRREYEAIALLKEHGYECIRAAGSKGHWDIVAWRSAMEPHPLRFIQCKADCKPTKAEMESLKMAHVPPTAIKELWIFRRNEPLEVVRIES